MLRITTTIGLADVDYMKDAALRFPVLHHRQLVDIATYEHLESVPEMLTFITGNAFLGDVPCWLHNNQGSALKRTS